MKHPAEGGTRGAKRQKTGDKEETQGTKEETQSAIKGRTQEGQHRKKQEGKTHCENTGGDKVWEREEGEQTPGAAPSSSVPAVLARPKPAASGDAGGYASKPRHITKPISSLHTVVSVSPPMVLPRIRQRGLDAALRGQCATPRGENPPQAD